MLYTAVKYSVSGDSLRNNYCEFYYVSFLHSLWLKQHSYYFGASLNVCFILYLFSVDSQFMLYDIGERSYNIGISVDTETLMFIGEIVIQNILVTTKDSAEPNDYIIMNEEKFKT